MQTLKVGGLLILHVLGHAPSERQIDSKNADSGDKVFKYCFMAVRQFR